MVDNYFEQKQSKRALSGHFLNIKKAESVKMSVNKGFQRG